jgi:hypothetical protein
MKTSARHTAVSASRDFTEVKFHSLPVLSLNKATITLRVLNDRAAVTRLNQALADLGSSRRVELFGGVDSPSARLLDRKKTVSADAFPAWNSPQTWIEFSFPL